MAAPFINWLLRAVVVAAAVFASSNVSSADPELEARHHPRILHERIRVDAKIQDPRQRNTRDLGMCGSFSSPDINFGSVTAAYQGDGNPAVPAVNATSIVSVICDPSLPFSIMLSPGSAGTQQPTYLGRTMLHGSDKVGYNLFRSLRPDICSLVGIWGDGTNSTSIAQGIGSGGPQNYLICALMPQQRITAFGAYSDTIVATLSF